MADRTEEEAPQAPQPRRRAADRQPAPAPAPEPQPAELAADEPVRAEAPEPTEAAPAVAEGEQGERDKPYARDRVLEFAEQLTGRRRHEVAGALRLAGDDRDEYTRSEVLEALAAYDEHTVREDQEA
jgi:hypothetical protein